MTAYKNAVNKVDVRSRLSNYPDYPDGIILSPHLFMKVAVLGICAELINNFKFSGSQEIPEYSNRLFKFAFVPPRIIFEVGGICSYVILSCNRAMKAVYF